MDPAEPHFADTQAIVRLDTSDAHFVDIIHTNAKPFISGGKIFDLDRVDCIMNRKKGIVAKSIDCISNITHYFLNSLVGK